jgi:hypothetical protein
MFLLVSAPSNAQQVTGTLGRADATTTINGKQIPEPPPKFGGVIKDNARIPRHGGRLAWCRRRARPTYSSS